jgi:rubrerythrin
MTHQRIEDVNWSEVSIEEILELAIADEEYARDYYKHAAHLAGTLTTRRMLMQLSEMEQGHADQLRKELGDLQQQRELEAGMAD